MPTIAFFTRMPITSNRDRESGYEVVSTQSVPSLTIALSIVRGFLARAMSATFGGLPAAIIRSYIGFSTGLKRDPFIAARYRAVRGAARSARILR